MTKARDAICDALIEAGVDHVFGMPGGGTIPIWDSLYDRQDKIKVVLCRHEQTAACMADLYGRLTGKPAVVMGQGPFIASLGGFGIIEAYLSSSPMLVLTDTSDNGYAQHGNYQSGTGEYGSFDIRGILSSMSKYTTYAATPEEAVQGVQLAIKHATVGRPGPACVVMRNNAITGEISPRGPRLRGTAGYVRKSFTVPPLEEIKQAAALLAEAKRPVIIAGNGTHLSGAHEELSELAEFLGAPVATSYKGKSAIAEIHPLAVGMMGAFGQKVANESIAEADLLLVAGSHLAPSDTKNESPNLIDPNRQKILQIDVDPRNAGWNFPVEMGLIGDLRATLLQILAVLKQSTGKQAPEAADRVAALQTRKQEAGFGEAPELYSDATPILPQRIVKEIEGAVGPSTLITLDAGKNRLWMAHFFRSKAARSVFAPGGAAGMGWGPAAALAAKLLYPERPVLSVSGDGGFAMVPHVLSTAAQHKLPVVFVVMNNSVLGWIYDMQRERTIASEFLKTDFAQIARAFGCQGITVNEAKDLGPALKEAFAAKMPTVVDVITSPGEHFTKIMER